MSSSSSRGIIQDAETTGYDYEHAVPCKSLLVQVRNHEMPEEEGWASRLRAASVSGRILSRSRDEALTASISRARPQWGGAPGVEWSHEKDRS